MNPGLSPIGIINAIAPQISSGMFSEFQVSILQNFFGIIYATSGEFPYDFDRGYADSDVITLKKVF